MENQEKRSFETFTINDTINLLNTDIENSLSEEEAKKRQ